MSDGEVSFFGYRVCRFVGAEISTLNPKPGPHRTHEEAALIIDYDRVKKT